MEPKGRPDPTAAGRWRSSVTSAGLAARLGYDDPFVAAVGEALLNRLARLLLEKKCSEERPL
jgi:hypothetical protein